MNSARFYGDPHHACCGMMSQQAVFLPLRLISIKRRLTFIAQCLLARRGQATIAIVDRRRHPRHAKRSGAYHDPGAGAGSVTKPIRVRPAFAAALMTRATLS